MSRGVPLTVLVALVIVLSVAPGTVTADAETNTTVEATTSIDTPSRTLTILGRDFNVSSLGRVEEGTEVSADVTRPGDDGFRVHLYDYDGNPITTIEGNSNGTYTLGGTDTLDPGTYLLALSIDGSFERVQPVVVSGYQFAVDAPAEASPDDPVSIDIELTGDASLPNYVEVVVMNDSMHRYTAAHIVDTRQYSVIVDELEPGEYRLYVSANNDSQVAGVSSVQAMTIGAGETATSTAPPPATTSTGDAGSSTTRQSVAVGTPSSTTRPGSPPTITTPAAATSIPSPTPTGDAVSGTKTGDASTSMATRADRQTPGSPDAPDTADAADLDDGSATAVTNGSVDSPTRTAAATPGFTVVTAVVGFALLFVARLRA